MLNQKEAAKLLGISTDTFVRYGYNLKIDSYLIGQKRYYEERDILEFKESLKGIPCEKKFTSTRQKAKAHIGNTVLPRAAAAYAKALGRDQKQKPSGLPKNTITSLEVIV